jgi:hypothetical protein
VTICYSEIQSGPLGFWRVFRRIAQQVS